MIIETADRKKCRAGMVLQCSKCGDVFGMLGRRISEIKISFICSCGEFKCFEFGKPKTGSHAVALCIKDTYVCPMCGEILFRLNKRTMRNFAFRAKCSCGCMYDKYKKSDEIKRKPGSFAIEEDN